jgi:hypothetical protein
VSDPEVLRCILRHRSGIDTYKAGPFSEDSRMISRRAAFFVTVTSLIAASTSALAKRISLVDMLDPDHDGTIDLNEAKTAAAAVFERLDSDKDGTLDLKELKGRLSGREFAAGDPDNDKTLSKDEYLAIVEQRFKAADPDNDGTVSAAELRTPSGRALARLLH